MLVMMAAMALATVLSGLAGSAAATGSAHPGRAVVKVQVGMVSFADTKHGWASGPMGALLRTKDGGRHWKRQYILEPSFVDQSAYSVEAVSAKVCWALGSGGAIYRTTNAGSKWTRVARRLRPSRFTGNCWWYCRFVGQRGWIVSTCGDIVGTTNGGATWSWQRKAAGGDDSVGGFSAAGAGHAFVALNAAGGHYVLATTDGKTWKQVGPRPFLWWNPQFQGIRAENASRIWVAARMGEVFLSEDGGQTWRVSNDGVGPDQLVVNSIGGYGTTLFVGGSPASGSVNSGAAVLSTSDGASWGWASFSSVATAPGTIGTTEWASEKTGWIVAWGGTIYRTQDGGATWQKQY